MTYSNLPGPFFLFDLQSVPGQLIAQLARPIPYLNPGTTWMLSKKYEGMSAIQWCRRPFGTHSHRIRCGWTGRCFPGDVLRISWERKQTQSDGPDRQITAFPKPKSNLYVADAEANKVRLLYLELSWTLPTPFPSRRRS
jgi:hypothetical protein